jgi:RNA polymerase sigma-70 factor (ECF subfamily)
MDVYKPCAREGDHAATTPPRAGLCEDRQDDELITMIAAGQCAAFETLYHRYAAFVYQMVMRIVQDRALADDLVQEVFLRIWRRSTSFAGERGHVVPWLCAMSHNVSVDELRRIRARPILVRGAAEHARIRLLPDDTADVLDCAMQQEQRRMLVVALQL